MVVNFFFHSICNRDLPKVIFAIGFQDQTVVKETYLTLLYPRLGPARLACSGPSRSKLKRARIVRTYTSS